MHKPDSPSQEQNAERPWIVLNNSYDVEAWIDSYNRDLQHAMARPNARGYGICFRLSHGGDIYLHTDQEGNVLLDVTPDAEWVTPLLAAAAGVEPPGTQIWTLPGHALTQLILGLSSLIASTRIVLEHEFRTRKY
jgi:hypothetical protein